MVYIELNFFIIIWFLYFSLLVSLVGVYILWNNFLLMLISIELSLLVLIYAYVSFSYLTDDSFGLALVIVILAVAAVETLLGILLVLNFVNKNNKFTFIQE